MRNWNEEILYTTIILSMESCWLGALFLLLSDLINGDRHLSIVGLWLAYPIALIFNRLLGSFKIRRSLLLIANVITMVIIMLIVLKIYLYAGYNMLDFSWLAVLNAHMHQLFQGLQSEMFIILGVATFFWKGWSLSRQRLDFSVFSKSFQFGFCILLFIIFIFHLVDFPVSNLVLLIIIFASLGLIGFGLYRSSEKQANQLTTMYSDLRLLLIVVGTIALLGIAIGSFITPDLLHLILNILKWIGEKIASVIIFLVNLFPKGGTSELPPGETLSPSPREEPIEMWKWFHMSVNVRDIMRKIFVSAFMIGILVALYQLFVDIWHWMRRHETTDVTIESISKYSFLDFLSSLVLFLMRNIYMLFCWLKALIRLKTPEQSNHNNSIRQIYRNLLHWGAIRGYPRRNSETPYEYLEQLGYMLPISETNILSQITEAYIVARYNPKPDKLESLQQIKEKWQILKKYKFKRVHTQGDNRKVNI
jgi:hypothetical protein